MSISHPGAVTGAPRAWLRLEGLTVLTLAVLLWERGGHSWPLLVILFLVPDLSFAGYLAGPCIGAVIYNLAHSYVGPGLATALALLTGRPPVIALIWAAHIGFDRALGYGLKYPTHFKDTHLGRLPGGRGRASAASTDRA